jgi:hypothetical protein
MAAHWHFDLSKQARLHFPKKAKTKLETLVLGM